MTVNLATFISIVVLVLVVSLAIRYIIREKSAVQFVSAARMPGPARSTAKNTVLQGTSVLQRIANRKCMQERRKTVSPVDYQNFFIV
jgi:hypothetical protein